MYYICKKIYYRTFFHIILKVDAFLTCFFSYIAGNLVTSRGPATAVEFGLTLVEVLLSNEEKDKVAKGILYPL